MTVNYAYLDADYDEVKNALGVNETANFRFTFAPAHSYAVNLDYVFPTTRLGVWTAAVGYSYQSKVFSRAIVNAGKYIIDNYGLLNARLSLSEIPVGVGELRFGLWGRNIENREYYIDHNTALVPFSVFGEPRSYGFDMIYEY